MSRKPLAPATVDHPEIDEARVAAAHEAMRSDAIAQQQTIASNVFGLGRAVGAAMMANMIKSISAAAEVRAFEEVNKSKAFKDLAITHPDGSIRPAENIDEFCRVIFGRGYKAMADQKVLLERLGEETYENATRLGLNRGQLRLLVSLPEEDRAIVEDAMRSESKPDVLAAIQTLASKLDEVRGQVDEMKAENQADKELLAEKNRLLDAERAKSKRIRDIPADEDLAELRKAVAAIADDARGAIVGQLREGIATLFTHHDKSGGDSVLWAAGIVGQLVKDIAALRDQFGLPDMAGAEAPEWLNA